MKEQTAAKKRPRNKIKDPLYERVMAWINIIILFLLSCTFIVPFLYVISMSFSTEEAIGLYGVTLFPKEWTLEAYEFIFSAGGNTILRAYGNTIIITVVGTILTILVTAGFAYPLAKKALPFRKAILIYVLFSMLVGGGLIPSYIIISRVLGLRYNLLAVILPGCYSSWNMILMRNFFSALPENLEEAALIDGANEIQVFFKFVLPLSKPIVATISLFAAVAYWNNWFGPLIYLDQAEQPTIMLFLKNVISSTVTSDSFVPGMATPPTQGVQMATVLACTVPIVCVYPFLQKYFATGIMMGSIKG